MSGVVNIFCLKWGTKYGPEYVNRLYAGIKRNTSLRFRFFCFTDDKKGIRPEVVSLDLKYASLLDSWWNKLWLFSDEMPLVRGQKVFYVDLDTLITGDIDQLLMYTPNKMMVLKDFYHGIAQTAGKLGSGLMSWKHGHYNMLWNEFIKDPVVIAQGLHPYGDQKWIEQKLGDDVYYWQDIFPDNVVSFKVHCQNGLPKDARIICYHGRPSIPESASSTVRDWKWKVTPQPWVLDYWRDQ